MSQVKMEFLTLVLLGFIPRDTYFQLYTIFGNCFVSLGLRDGDFCRTHLFIYIFIPQKLSAYETSASEILGKSSHECTDAAPALCTLGLGVEIVIRPSH